MFNIMFVNHENLSGACTIDNYNWPLSINCNVDTGIIARSRSRPGY